MCASREDARNLYPGLNTSRWEQGPTDINVTPCAGGEAGPAEEGSEGELIGRYRLRIASQVVYFERRIATCRRICPSPPGLPGVGVEWLPLVRSREQVAGTPEQCEWKERGERDWQTKPGDGA